VRPNTVNTVNTVGTPLPDACRCVLCSPAASSVALPQRSLLCLLASLPRLLAPSSCLARSLLCGNGMVEGWRHYDSFAFEAAPKLPPLWGASEWRPLAVDSCFGGLAFYDLGLLRSTKCRCVRVGSVGGVWGEGKGLACGRGIGLLGSLTGVSLRSPIFLLGAMLLYRLVTRAQRGSASTRHSAHASKSAGERRRAAVAGRRWEGHLRQGRRREGRRRESRRRAWVAAGGAR